MTDFRALYIDEAFRSLRGHKRLADGAIEQLSDEQFFAAPSPESNSVAVIMKHLAGNMRSRFTDFLTTDGEKPDRNRDREFIVHADAKREEVVSSWEKNWQLVFETLNSLRPERPGAHCHHSRGAALRVASHQPPDDALCLSCRADRVSGQAVEGRTVEDTERSQRPERTS